MDIFLCTRVCFTCSGNGRTRIGVETTTRSPDGFASSSAYAAPRHGIPSSTRALLNALLYDVECLERMRPSAATDLRQTATVHGGDIPRSRTGPRPPGSAPGYTRTHTRTCPNSLCRSHTVNSDRASHTEHVHVVRAVPERQSGSYARGGDGLRRPGMTPHSVYTVSPSKRMCVTYAGRGRYYRVRQPTGSIVPGGLQRKKARCTVVR